MATHIIPSGIIGKVGNVSLPAVNTAATITYAAQATGMVNNISGVMWNYSGSPTGGLLTIKNGTNVVFSIPIVVSGTDNVVFPIPIKSSPAMALVIELAAGGSGVTGVLNVLNHWVSPDAT